MSKGQVRKFSNFHPWTTIGFESVSLINHTFWWNSSPDIHKIEVLTTLEADIWLESFSFYLWRKVHCMKVSFQLYKKFIDRDASIVWYSTGAMTSTSVLAYQNQGKFRFLGETLSFAYVWATSWSNMMYVTCDFCHTSVASRALMHM